MYTYIYIYQKNMYNYKQRLLIRYMSCAAKGDTLLEEFCS